MKPPAHGPVLIVGAGPTGLLLALWLARRGTELRLIDKAAGPGETSRAMVVHARTLEFYRQLGFAEEVVRAGLKIEHVAIREAGARRGSLSFGDLGAGQSAFPFVLAFPQDEHELVLIGQLAAAGVSVERNVELTGFEQDEDGVWAHLLTPTGPETFAASYVAGCDGAHSTVRTSAGIGLPGGTYEQRFFVADAQVEGEASRDSMSICLSRQDFCMAIPLRRSGAARLIGIVPDGIDADHARFEDVAPSVRRNTGLEILGVNWFSTYRVHHRVSERFRDRRCFLLGDAAHLHSPAGGQGMNTGLGDAVNLAWKLAAVLAGRAHPTLLGSYEPERLAFARTLVATTDRIFSLVTNRGPLGRLWRTVVMARLLPLAFRLPAVPRAAFAQVSQTEIEYRRGPLSQGQVGRVRAGDRLPWIDQETIDNFAGLSTLDWQAHVHGTPSAGLRAALAEAGIELCVFDWSRHAGGKGLARDALYLVRPDGYLGLVDGGADPAALGTYVARWGLRGG